MRTWEPVEAFDLHDYLLQDHLTRYGSSATQQGLWDTLVSHGRRLADPERIAEAAEDRGLLTAAIELLRVHADTRYRSCQDRPSRPLLDRGDVAALGELRARADTGDEHAQSRRTSRIDEVVALRDRGPHVAHREPSHQSGTCSKGRSPSTRGGEMTAVDESDPFLIGLQQALNRLKRAGLQVTGEAAGHGLDLAEAALHDLTAAPPARATELFVEQVVVAVAMREFYDEPALKPVEVGAFLGVARWFFNSLWHEHP